jgi:hypothetical protein
MNNNLINMLMIALRNNNAVSPDVMAAASTGHVELKMLDQAYLNFLDEQIALEPRGPEWTKILQTRRTALTPYCGRSYLSGHIRIEKKEYVAYIDPEALELIHNETYDYEESV